MKNLINVLVLSSLVVSCGYDSRGDVHELYKQLNDSKKKLNDLTDRLETYIITIDENTNAISQHDVDFYQLEENLIEMNNRLNVVENDNPKIVDVIKPCPTSKEVLLELDTGDLLGYFENGNKRYLSVLESGNYRTTDGTNCNFSIE